MPKRAAPIRYAPSGRPYIRCRINGRQVYETFDTEAQATRWWHQVEADKARGAAIDPRDGRITVRQLGAQYLERFVGAHGTTELVRNSLVTHLYPVVGDHPVGQVRKSMLQAGVKQQLEPRLAPSTIQTTHQHWVTFFQAAVDDRIIATNPATGLKLPKVPPTELVIPTVDEVATITTNIEPRFRALVVVGYGLGLRQGEAFGLSVDRVDFLRRRVIIDRQLKRNARGSELGTLKTENSYRTIPLPSSVGDELARHIAEHPNDDPDGLLFTASMGGRLRRDGWNRRVWKPAVTAAGRPELGYHSMRHFFASCLIRAGQSAPTVAKRLGNSAAMVLSTYSHLWPDDDDRTRQAIDGLFTAPVADEVAQ